MSGHRLRQLRLARGMSLEGLAAATGGLVSRQAIWKYEHDRAKPSATIANKLASALEVKTIDLEQMQEATIQFIAYRKRSRLTKTEQERIQAFVRLKFEERVRIERRLGQLNGKPTLPAQQALTALGDAERIAEDLRKTWDLGKDAIGNLIGALEDHHIHVLEIDADQKFDGISAIAKDPSGNVIAAMVVTNRGLPGERQRLNLAHELGHIVTKIAAESIDDEEAAFRFGAAFLLPAPTLVNEVGAKRRSIQFEELLLLKRRYGLSMQAILHRMCRDLGIITDSHYKEWCIEISRCGYRKSEPGALAPEESTWLQRNVLRALAEGVVSAEEARTLGVTSEYVAPEPLKAIERRAFFKLPMAERRKLLAAQAEKLATHYEADDEWRDLGGTEIVEY